jgi:hypothetical protein
MKKILYIVVILVIAVSCKTYTVAPESFKQQLLKSESQKDVVVSNPFGGTLTYKANTLKTIDVVAKDGSEVTLNNSPSVEMRVTLANGKRRIMYFDTVLLRNDTLYAEGSRFLGVERKIAFDSIVKIEIQDGGKKFNYQK